MKYARSWTSSSVGGAAEADVAFFRGLPALAAIAFFAGAAVGVPSLGVFLGFLGTVLEIFIALLSLSRFASSFCRSLAYAE